MHLTLLQTIVSVPLRGGVSPVVVTQPAVGVLLRLSIACYLGIPLAAVVVTGATSSDAMASAVSLGVVDAVNVANGLCADVATNSSRRELAEHVQLQSQSHQARRRHLGAEVVTTIWVSVAACNAATNGSYAFTPQLAAALAGLGGGNPAGGASPAPASTTQSSPSFLSTFLASAAAAAGVPRTSVVTAAPLGVGPAGPAPSSTPSSTSPSTRGDSSSSFSVEANAAVIGGAVAAFIIFLAVVAIAAYFGLWAHRRTRSADLQKGGAVVGSDKGDESVSYDNRMYGYSDARRRREGASAETGKAPKATVNAVIAHAQSSRPLIGSAAGDSEGTFSATNPMLAATLTSVVV